jgi:hypothetical protein
MRVPIIHKMLRIFHNRECVLYAKVLRIIYNIVLNISINRFTKILVFILRKCIYIPKN